MTRRIPIPGRGTEMAKHGIISKARMAHILAVARLALCYKVPGNCTHEPNVIGIAAGANSLLTEAGSNPRDTEKSTEHQRGMTVNDCIKVFEEGEWQILRGPSKFYSASFKSGRCVNAGDGEQEMPKSVHCCINTVFALNEFLP